MSQDARRAGPRPGMLQPHEVRRLARAVQQRQAELGLTIAEVLTPNTYKSLVAEDPRPIRVSTLGKLDKSLRWRTGSALRVAREGGAPEPIPEGSDLNAPLTVWLPEGPQSATVEEVWVTMGEVSAKAPDLSPATRANIVVVLRELMSRDGLS